MSLSSLVRPRPYGGSALVRDYLQQTPQALAFYSGPPFNLESSARKAEEVSARFGLEARRRAAAALRSSTPEAERKLTRFVADGGVMITTGQQAGFLTGPLFTVFKALSAVALARRLEGLLSVPVLPV